MLNYLYAIASFGFLIWIVRNVFVWGELLQKNSYSIKHVLLFLISHSGGRTLLFSPLSLLKWFVIFLYPLIIFNEAYESVYHLLITVIYVTEAIFVFETLWRRKTLRPELLSLKTITIIGLTFMTAVIFFLFAPIDTYLWLVLVDRSVVLLLFLFITIISLPEEFYWEYRLLKTVERHKNLEQVTTIVLLGGVEATVAKRVLYHALAERFTVLSAPDQPDIRAVIQTIERNRDTDPQIFLTDFHTDNLQFLRQLALLISPRYVIIESLPLHSSIALQTVSDSISVFLKNRKRLKPQLFSAPEAERAHGSYAQERTIGYPRAARKRKTPLFVERLIQKPASTSFRIRYKNKSYRVETSLVTERSAHLLLPVVGVLAELGYDQQAILQVIKTAVLPRDFLHFSGERNRHIINNTSETDPRYLDHFSEYLNQFRKKKILILDADILGGKVRRGEAFKMGKTLARQFQYVFFISSPAERGLQRGIKAGNKRVMVTSAGPEKITEYLETVSEKGDLLLFYGPRTERVLEQFLTKGS